MLEPPEPNASENQNTSPGESVPSQSSERVQAPEELAHNTMTEANRELPPLPAAQASWSSKYGFGVAFVCLVLAVCVSFAWVGQRLARSLLSYVASHLHQPASAAKYPHSINTALQAQAEQNLKRLASGDPAAADLVLSQSDNWTGNTRRTQNTDQLVTAAINLPDLHAREAAIQAQLALDGISRNEAGLSTLKQAVGNPRQRPWVLWSLGALGNRGVDPVHTAKIIESYLNDPDPNVRAEAVDGLALLATDETLPMMLDRFRNDPSPIVQEHSACDMSQSGMYTHAQRMRAAASLVGWLDDPLLTGQQRIWTFQALRDITGAPLGSDTAAWHNWWSQHSRR